MISLSSVLHFSSPLPRELRLTEEFSRWTVQDLPVGVRTRKSRGLIFLPLLTHLLTCPTKENFNEYYIHHLHLKSSTYSHILMLFRKCSWLEQNSYTKVHEYRNAFHSFSEHQFSSTSISAYSRQISSVISSLTRSKDISSVASSSAIHENAEA